MMLNMKKIFLDAEKKNEVENFAHFQKDVFFRKNDSFQILRIF
jgi:hypothetical protein